MFAKVIGSNGFSVVSSENPKYRFSNKILFVLNKANSEDLIRCGDCKTIPGMDRHDYLVLKYYPDIKKRHVIGVYSSEHLSRHIEIIPSTKVGSGIETKKPYALIEENNVCKIRDMVRDITLGIVLSSKDIADKVVVSVDGLRSGFVVGVIREIEVDENKLYENQLLIIENKLGRLTIPDLREMCRHDKVNGEEIIRTLAKLLEDRVFDHDHVGKINFAAGEFLERVVHYLDVLEEIDKDLISKGGPKIDRRDYFQNAITIAIRVNIGNGRKKFISDEEFERDVISRVLKLGLKSFIKMTQSESVKSPYGDALAIAEKNELVKKVESGIPEEYREELKKIIEKLCLGQRSVVKDSAEILVGIIRGVFNERGYILPEKDYYKLILAIGSELSEKHIKVGMNLVHSKLSSFFRTLANAFDPKYFNTESFAAEFKKAFLLTLIDVNYGKQLSTSSGLLAKYKPEGGYVPPTTLPNARRLEYHRLVLSSIESDQELNDPFDVFFESERVIKKGSFIERLRNFTSKE